MRLDKFIADNSDWSRSDIKRLIKNKRVEIDNELVGDSGVKVDPQNVNVAIDGESLINIGELYFMLHKPVGYVCANRHSEHPLVMDLLNDLSNQQRKQLQIVGRLDLDTSGLVLLTNNGQWNHRVTSPNSECVKYYRVELLSPFDDATSIMFENGMLLEGESKITRKAYLEKLTENTVRLGISEGRYHQVKRMFSHTGNSVTALHRESVGEIVLDSTLQPGEYRPLTSAEITSVL